MDTGGKEQFDSINIPYYKKVDCCFLVYDITNENSFMAIENHYVKEIKDFCKENIPVILVGNKTDLKDERKISSKKGAILAEKYNFIFKETSCKNNSNVIDAFEAIITMTHTEKMKKGEYQNETKNFRITNQTRKKNKKCVCVK